MPGRPPRSQSRFAGAAFQAAARDDLDRLARGTGGTVTAHWGGHAVVLRDPSGFPVRVVYGVPELPALPERAPLPLNFGPGPARVNATQRPARQPAEIERLGHVVLGTTRFARGPGLVPGHARADRQRLPVPGRAARPRPGDGVHPLRPGQRPGRPSHPGHGAAAAHRVRALGLPAHRPGRGRRQRAVPARARLPARVGPGPAHPGQPDLRLLARHGPADVRALRRRRRVRLHRPSPAGRRCRSAAWPSGDRRRPPSSPAPATPASSSRRSRRCATRATRSTCPRCAA